MLLIAVYDRRCGRNLRAKLYTAINSLSANHAYLKTLRIVAAACFSLENCYAAVTTATRLRFDTQSCDFHACETSIQHTDDTGAFYS